MFFDSQWPICNRLFIFLQDAECQLIEMEEDIERLDKDKINFTQELDRVQKEALIWQRKVPYLRIKLITQSNNYVLLNIITLSSKYIFQGILAVELKRNIKNAQSASGEIGQMKNEIHRMEVKLFKKSVNAAFEPPHCIVSMYLSI